MKKKGFTLIELLAVIVVLAVIALIATPLVLNTIENTKKGAAKSSATTYIKEIEKEIMTNMVSDTSYIIESITEPGYVKVKGDNPSEVNICIGSDGVVEKASLKINGYVVNYDGNEATTTDLEEIEINCYKEYKTGTNSEVTKVYYNPVDGKLCTEEDYNNNTDKLGKTGCLKWYAIENSDSDSLTVDVILDHNTTATVAFTDSQTELDKLVSESNWKVTPRLINAAEVANISGHPKFDIATTTQGFYLGSNVPEDYSKRSDYSWLFNYTSCKTSVSCEIADANVHGYWTSTSVASNPIFTWCVANSGNMGNNNNKVSDLYGIRPVITINKSDKVVNLIKNGDLSYKDNTNFKKFTYEDDGYLSYSSSAWEISSDELIAINPENQYLYSMELKSNNENAKHYSDIKHTRISKRIYFLELYG